MRVGVRVAFLISLIVSLGACSSIDYASIRPGTLKGRVVVMWVGYDKFVYVPAPNSAIDFETAGTRKIQPGLMYTDGGSIPRQAQIFRGFSPWGFGPAYAIHDWIFYGHHCLKENYNPTLAVRVKGTVGYRKFDDVAEIDFKGSATYLAEAIKTLVDTEQVKDNPFAASIISNAVDSKIAAGLWDAPDNCDRSRVSAWHTAVVWKAVLGVGRSPPASWRLSKEEVDAAYAKLTLVPDKIDPTKTGDDPEGLPSPTVPLSQNAGVSPVRFGLR